MRKKLKGIAIASITVFSGIAMVTASLAWFLEMTTYSLEQANIDANSGGAYFAYGDGSETKPYGIATTRHLYNLAWMQYLGLFDDKQYYFELANDVDMSGYYLPPIGTENHPFLGEFNGQGHSVTGLTVSNSYSDFTGYSQAPELVPSDSFVAPEIVGFFGVVGKLPDTTTTYTYNSAVNTFKDTTLNDLEIVTKGSAKLLTGFAAGYASATLSNIDVGGSSKINVNGQNHTSFTDHLTDYGLVGFTTNKGNRGTYSQDLSEFYDGNTGGEGQDWGGSVTMQNMYNRLKDIAGDATRNNSYSYEKDVVTRNNGTTFERNHGNTYRAYTYRNQKEGSIVFSAYASNGSAGTDDDENYLYLSGGTKKYPIKQTETQVSGGYKISYNGHYLGVSGTSIADHQDAWSWKNNLLSIVINGTKYYLTHNLTLSETTQEEWTQSSNRFYYRTTSWFTTTYYYITYDNGWVKKTASRKNDCTQLTWTNSTYTDLVETSNGQAYMDYTGTNVTYFPLITEQNNYNASEKNTGYVMSGSDDRTTSGTWPYKTGDIRVSKYAVDAVISGKARNILNSYDPDTKQLTNVYTISPNLQTVKINEADYVKYQSAKNSLLDMISDGDMFGLHFMSASININSLVTADYALINKQTKSNYQMPANSIDFNLMEKGYINFFSGTYFEANNSFFSLHTIERDASDNITAIKEITEIYGSSNKRKDYIYKYSNGSYSASLTEDYSLVFSTNRIKKQSSVTNCAVYYFEVPVNAGEYALGSVDGGTGCYLMYLDIGTNGAPPDIVKAYSITTKSTACAHPIGVDFAPVDVAGEGGETFGIYIDSGKTGAIIFAVTTANVNITDSNSLATYSFKGTKFSDNTPPAGNFSVSGTSPGQLILPPVGGTRVLMIHLTTFLDHLDYTIRITDYLTDTSGNYNETQSKYEIDSGEGFVTSDIDGVESLSQSIKLNVLRGLNRAATLTRSSGVQEFETTYDFENSVYKTKILDVDIDAKDTSILVNVTDGYTFKIGGTQYNSGSIYPST